MKFIAALIFVAAMQTATRLTAPPVGLDRYMPVPADNPPTREGIDMGRRLFFDRRLSRDHTVSCASCHRPERAFSDGRPLSIGVRGRVGSRNAPALINRGYGRLFFWDGRLDTLEEQVTKPIEDPREMDLPIATAVARTGLSGAEIAKALASYVRSITSGNSRFDRFIAGDAHALSEEEQLGLKTFRTKGNCVTCHIGPTFTDEQLHNTGVSWRANSSGGGRFRDVGAGRGDFKTPTLRDLARTAPYMHDGTLSTLGAVIDFYDRGGRPNPYLDPEIRPRRFTAQEKAALEAFLRALSGEISS